MRLAPLAASITLVVSSLAFAGGPGDSAYQTEKVVMVVLDGLRLQESYKHDLFPDPIRPPVNHTPRITAEIIPRGTLFTNARTGAFNTITTPCCNTLTTGAWQVGPNRGRLSEDADEDYVDNRTIHPTLFEHLRRDQRRPASKVVGITNKLNSRLCNHGFHPFYGESVGPEWKVISGVGFNPVEPNGGQTYLDPANNDDLAVFETALEVIQTQEPDFLFVYFGLLDIAGHLGARDLPNSFSFYTDTIDNVDNLIAELWLTLRSHPAYADNTTFVLTSDHGRHEDHRDLAYSSHRGTCVGCRDLLMFVAGPDTPAGLVVDRRVWQTDVAVTIAAVLGLDMPWASGQPLFEALEPPPPPRTFLQNTRVTLSGEGLIATYRDSANGENRIVIRRCPETHDRFGAPVPVAVSPGSSLVDFPEVLQDDTGIHVAYWQWTEANHRLLYRNSSDGGASFPDPPRMLVKGKIEESPTEQVNVDTPILLNHLGEERLVLPVVIYGGRFIGSYITDLNFGTAGYKDAEPAKRFEDHITDVRRQGFQRWLRVAAAANGDLLAAYSALRLPSDPGTTPYRATWDIFFKNMTATSDDPQEAIRLTDNNADPNVMPTLVVGSVPAERAFIVYAGVSGDGTMQLFLTQSEDEEMLLWSVPLALTASPVGVWEPSTVIDGETLHIVYTDFGVGNGDIHFLSVTAGQSAPAVNLSDSPTVSRNATILATPSGKLRVVWEEQQERGEFSLQAVSIIAPQR